MKKKYLIAFNCDINGLTGFGSNVITIKFGSIKKYFQGYSEKDMHSSRVLIATLIRKNRNIPQNKRVRIVIMNIIKIPLK